MKIAGIIAEFNPFHAGHQYLLDTVRNELHADAVIVVMSGNFVQRGAPAIEDKFTRTRQALVGGADLVLELPVRFSLSSAELFASAGVALLDQLGIVDQLVFGMEETADIPGLKQLSAFLLEEPEEYRQLLKEHLRQGMSFPTARSQVLRESFPELPHSLLNTPNNILAVAYCKALLKFHSSINPCPILRKGTISAHRIRKERQEQQKSGIYTDDFSQAFQLRHWESLHTPGTALCPKDVEFTPELFHRLCREIQPQDSLSQLILKCKSKQYTHSRISRCFFRYLLQLPAPLESSQCIDFAPYIRVLGFHRESAWLLGKIREQTHIPLVQKLADDQKKLTDNANTLLKEDIAAHEYYRLITMQKYPNSQLRSDYQNGLILL